jgi:hypothetical protein
VAKPKYLGTLRRVLSSISGDVVQVNEDLEALSYARAVLAKGRDLVPRIYAIPSAQIKIHCQATLSEGRVKMFGLGGSSDKQELVDITVEMPLNSIPPTVDQVDLISKTAEEEIRRKLAERGLRGELTGSTFVPDVDEG